MANGPQQQDQQAPEQMSPDQENQSPLQPLQDLQSAMTNVQNAMKEAGAPPEAMKLLDQAVSAYGQFLQMVSGSPAPSRPGGQVVAADQAGASNVQPA